MKVGELMPNYYSCSFACTLMLLLLLIAPIRAFAVSVAANLPQGVAVAVFFLFNVLPTDCCPCYCSALHAVFFLFFFLEFGDLIFRSLITLP